MCVSYDNEVWQGESWTAKVAPITTTSAVAAQKDAYLFSLLGDSTYTTNDIQEAIWELSAANPSSVPTTSIDPTLLSDAATAVSAADEGGSATFDDGQYLLYEPVPSFSSLPVCSVSLCSIADGISRYSSCTVAVIA
jgi:hypothetical protein